MQVELKSIKLSSVFEGFYEDQDTNAVEGLAGKLNIRPSYQRNYCYTDEQAKALVDSVSKNYPIGLMYWAKVDEDKYEVMDGQQRTIALCHYMKNIITWHYNGHICYFHNLPQEVQDTINNYELKVYICTGTREEILSWFKIINTAGLKLTDQELRNISYTGPWLEHAKSIFSKPNGAAYQLSKDFVKADVNRQELLELALMWRSENPATKDGIEEYMASHQNDANASPLWQYFQAILNWARMMFPTKNAVMKQVNWGRLYKLYHDNEYNATNLDEEVKTLMGDEDVTCKKGIYEYVLSRDPHVLNIRAFDSNTKRTVYEQQEHKCAQCHKVIDFSDAEADHITPWIEGGKTVIGNCQILCKPCNRRKSDN